MSNRLKTMHNGIKKQLKSPPILEDAEVSISMHSSQRGSPIQTTFNILTSGDESRNLVKGPTTQKSEPIVTYNPISHKINTQVVPTPKKLMDKNAALE